MCFFPFILSQKDSTILFHLYAAKCFLSCEFGSALASSISPFSSFSFFLFLFIFFSFNEDSLFEKKKTKTK